MNCNTQNSNNGDRNKELLQRKFISMKFAIGFILLIILAIGLKPLLAYLNEYYSKMPIELRKTLELFDSSKMPSFTENTEDSHYNFLEGDVGTDNLTTRAYQYSGNDPKLINKQAALIVTYYSDPHDTVPHTPDVCYRQAGMTVSNVRKIEFSHDHMEGGPRNIEAMAMDVNSSEKEKRVVIYLFYSNSRIYSDRESTRIAINWPGDKYTYFSKIEAVSEYINSKERTTSLEICKKLISEALVILAEDHFPTKEQVQRR